MSAARAYDAWWLPAHVVYRYVAVTADGHKTWHRSLDDATTAAGLGT